MATDASVPHRIFGVFRAPETAAVWLIAVLLGFFGVWSWVERNAEAEARRIPEASVIAVDTSEKTFRVSFRGSKPRYVAIYQCHEDGLPEQLFPMLGTPHGMAWPIPAATQAILPAPDREFRLAHAGARIFVLSSSEGVPLLPEELWSGDLKKLSGVLNGVAWMRLDYPAESGR